MMVFLEEEDEDQHKDTIDDLNKKLENLTDFVSNNENRLREKREALLKTSSSPTMSVSRQSETSRLLSP